MQHFLRRLFLLLLLVVAVALLPGCSVMLSGVGTSWTDLPGFPREGTERAGFEEVWGKSVGQVVDAEGRRYEEYHYRVRQPRGFQAGMGEGMLDIMTLGLAEVVLTPMQLARVAGVSNYTMKVCVEWGPDGRAVGRMLRRQPNYPEMSTEWTRVEFRSDERARKLPAAEGEGGQGDVGGGPPTAPQGRKAGEPGSGMGGVVGRCGEPLDIRE